jgi:hypothetical protein
MTKQFKFSRRRVILKKSKRPMYDGAAEKNVTGVITTGHIITGEHDISTRVKETPISPPPFPMPLPNYLVPTTLPILYLALQILCVATDRSLVAHTRGFIHLLLRRLRYLLLHLLIEPPPALIDLFIFF